MLLLLLLLLLCEGKRRKRREKEKGKQQPEQKFLFFFSVVEVEKNSLLELSIYSKTISKDVLSMVRCVCIIIGYICSYLLRFHQKDVLS